MSASTFEYVANAKLLEKLQANGGLDGISKDLIDQHFALYKGYVTNLNALRKELAESRDNPAAKADRRRRFGFEYNGVALHELYFSNMIPKGTPISDKVKAKLAEAFGSYENWEKEFKAVGASRSIGWAILYYDPVTGVLNNHFVQLHEDGNVSGFQPILVLDVWEHAYILDVGATNRAKYIDAFMKNIDWAVVEQRFEAATSGKTVPRF